jgi:hypothetical protein
MPTSTSKKSAGSPTQKGKYAFDAGDLLGGILSETQDEANAEEKRLQAELQARLDADRRAKEDEQVRKRRAVEAALAEEQERQAAAAALRDRVQQVVEELEHEAESGSLRSAEHEVSGLRPVDFATARSHSYSHTAVPERRPIWLLAAMVATVVLLLGGGAATAFVLMSGPSLDPNSYPKSSLHLEGVSNNGSVVVALNHVPRPEPERTVIAVPETTEQAPQATATNGRNRERERERARERERERQLQNQGTTPTQTGPLNISLDGSGIFDRGSE